MRRWVLGFSALLPVVFLFASCTRSRPLPPIARITGDEPSERPVPTGTADAAIGVDRRRAGKEIRQILVEHPKIVTSESRPDLPDDMRGRIVALQPDSGDALLRIIADPEDELNRQATNVLIKVWDSLLPRQIDTYFRVAMTAYVEARSQYPQGKSAYVGMGYRIRYGGGGWPEADGIAMRTVSYRIVDGEQYAEPFRYENYQASTGGILLENLVLGVHEVQAVTEYEVCYGGEAYSGRAESPVAAFEIVQPFARDVMAVREDPELDKLVRRAFRIAETASGLEDSPASPGAGDLACNSWAQHVSGVMPNMPAEFGVRGLVYKVTEPLPVDLCFDVEFHLEKTGEVFKGDPIVCGERGPWGGSLAPRHAWAFAQGREGYIPLRVVLRSSRETALSRPDVGRYWGGTIRSAVMRARVYWFTEDAAPPWLIESRARFEELKRNSAFDDGLCMVTEGLVSLNPYRRFYHASGAARWLSPDQVRQVLPFLVALLADTDTDLTEQPAKRAREALIKTGPLAVELLKVALDSEDESVREHAEAALEAIAAKERGVQE